MYVSMHMYEAEFICIIFWKFYWHIVVYNVVLVSTVQQSESAVCIHVSPLLCIPFSFRSPQSPIQF